MKNRTVLFSLLLGLASHSVVSAHNGAATAYAISLPNIKVDGRLDDWPTEIVRYPILTNGRAYGSTDIDHADLRTSPDLNGFFMVGFDPGQHLIYLAVRVQDDSLVDGGANPWQNDACEVYVDGDHSGGQISNVRASASQLPALQFVGIPGKGNHGIDKKNPAMAGGDISLTRTKYSFNRQGDVTNYEWAIEAYDTYPESPTKLTAGKRLGFDAVLVDKDTPADTSAWICWADAASLKFCDAGLRGDLVLVESPAVLGTVSGTAQTEERKPCANLDIEAWQGNLPGGTVRTDAEGKFQLKIPTFKALHDLYADKGLSILALSTDQSDDVVKRFIKENKINFPVMMVNDEVKEAYGGIAGVPTTFIIDGQGMVRYAQLGAPANEMQLFQRMVEKLLAE